MTAKGVVITAVSSLRSDRGVALKKMARKAADELPREGRLSPFQAAAGDSAVVALNAMEDVIGFGVLRDVEEDGILWLGIGWVRPFYRRMGIYRALVDEAARVAAENGFRSLAMGVSVVNAASMEVHNRLGLTMRRHPNFPPTVVVFERRLA